MSSDYFLVLGAGITGRAVVEFFLGRGIPFRVSSLSPIPIDLKENLRKAGVDFEEGKHTLSWLSEAKEIILSPSIRYDALPWEVRSRCISELDLSQRFFKGKIVAITGTNGKSSTVSMLASVLNQAGIPACACGNIGTPFISKVDDPVSVAVVEVSSFQLFNSREFTPDGFAVLNISPDHLDWHESEEEYIQAKISPIERMNERQVVWLNWNDSILRDVGLRLGRSIDWFRSEEGLDENEACVVRIGRYFGIDERSLVSWLKTECRPLKYRCEVIGEKGGVVFVNDSKATNVASTLWAIKKVTKDRSGRRVILLCGGRGKNLDYGDLLSVADSIKCVIAFGEEGDSIVARLRGVVFSLRVPDLASAFERSISLSQPGDVVLLSPMCASFDQYENYEKRGAHFDSLVVSYLQSK